MWAGTLAHNGLSTEPNSEAYAASKGGIDGGMTKKMIYAE